MTELIKEVLMERDGLTEAQAEELIADATRDLRKRLVDGEIPFNICEEWFGLEPDYIYELM